MKILMCPLSWGLGHVTRDIPIIDEFIRRGHQVSFGTSGRAALMLKERYPDLQHHHLPDYPVSFPKNKWFVASFIGNAPRTIWHMKKEAENSRKLIGKHKFDLVLSDQRYNVWHPDVPCFLYNHQIRFMGPKWFQSSEVVLEMFNTSYFKKYAKVIVPDFESGDTLSGRLSHDLHTLGANKLHYAGPISSVKKKDVEEDIDYFISVSGPEPQRSVFEKIVLKQAQQLDGRVVIALGKPEEKKSFKVGKAEVHTFLNRHEQQDMLNRAKLVICRSGYTTMMELAELGKRALLVPTVGQTEQVYLADYYKKKAWFFCKDQYNLDLKKDVGVAEMYHGFPKQVDSKRNVKELYEDVFAEHLE